LCTKTHPRGWVSGPEITRRWPGPKKKDSNTLKFNTKPPLACGKKVRRLTTHHLLKTREKGKNLSKELASTTPRKRKKKDADNCLWRRVCWSFWGGVGRVKKEMRQARVHFWVKKDSGNCVRTAFERPLQVTRVV